MATAPAPAPPREKSNPKASSTESKNRREDDRANSVSASKRSAKTTSGEFEFCEVCKLNHDQGRRHRYSRAHASTLAALLVRFHKKLTDIRFFLRHPSPLRAEHAHLNRLWCHFCAVDLQELGSPFACSNAIYHLASFEHHEKTKEFLRKHGGGTDQMESFRVSEVDLLKWEKCCLTLKNAASVNSCEVPVGPSFTLAKDIQHETTSSNVDFFETNSVISFPSNASCSVMPLQNLTNENQRKCCLEFSGATVSGLNPYTVSSGSMSMHGCARSLAESSKSSDEYHGCYDSTTRSSVCWSLNNGVGRRTETIGDCTNALQNLTRISLPSEDCQPNVHTGAPPPWLELGELNEGNMVNKRPQVDKLGLASSKTGKRKLNPKRVGAAWAEKRRAELEMEKRGEIVAKSPDVNWLPNFGRVWQAGTRKESRKEFEMEKIKLFKNYSQSELSSNVQPYISKRMRKNIFEDCAVNNGHVEESTNSFLSGE